MFKGSFVAIVTPFNETGKIDEKALKELLEWHVEQGTDGIVCFGTTGESPTLTDEEKVFVMSFCKKTLKGKIPLIAGTGTNATKKSVELTQEAKKIGVDGTLVVVPYYNRPTAEGCLAHFREIAKVGLPVIVYHHPGRTGVKLAPKTFSLLEKIPHVVAIKEASGDVAFVKEIQKECSLPIFSGDDDLTVPIMQMGGVGVISVVANLIPNEWKQLTTLCFEKKFDEAQAKSQQWKEMVKTLFLETNPQCIKYAMSLTKKCLPQLRLPLLEPTEQTKEKLLEVLKRHHLT